MKTKFYRMLNCMIFSNVSMFVSLLSRLNVPEKKIEEKFYPISAQSTARTVTA